MANKLNLQIGQGNGFNELNRYSLKFDIQNNDSSTVSLSALRVVSYGWLPQRNILTQFTSGVNALGNLSQFTSTVDPNYGISQNGIVYLNQTSSTYRVYHNVVDSSKIAPQLTLNVPSGGASIGTVSYINNTDSYFDIVIDSPAPTTGYSISWFLPGNYTQYTGSVTPLPSPSLTIAKLSAEYIRNKSRKADTQFILSWPGATTTIPQNWGISGTDVYISFNNLYPSNDILSAWYSRPDQNVLDNPYYVLQQFDGSNWNTVSEYITSGTQDTLTGIVPSDNYFLRFISSGVGTSSVYIGPSYSNPISANTADKNSLFLNSKGGSDLRRRSLISFNTSAIPSSATSIKSAILRLNVNALQNGYNYIGTSGNVGVYRVTNSWVENQVTWAKRTSSTSWSTSGGDYVDSPALWLGNSTLSNSFTSADQNSQFWMDFDVTSMVDYWRLNPSQNYGFLVKLFDSVNENNSTNIQWTINSNKDGGTGTILGYPELLVSYNVLNNQGPVPSLTISNPSQNQNIPLSNFSVNAQSYIAGGNLETVDLYYKVSNTNNAYTYYGSLSSTDNQNWLGTFSSIGVGKYDILVRGTSDLGIAGQSSPVTVNFIPNPTVTYTSGYLCHNGTISFNGTIDVTNSSPISGYLSYPIQDIPSSATITKIFEDKVTSNIVWVATDGDGLYRIDKSTNNIKKIVSPYNINSIVDMNMDGNGLIWISVQDSTKVGLGLVSFNSLNWSSSTFSDWAFYNKSNSILSAYSYIDIASVEVDTNNFKWLSLTKNNTNSIVSFSGTTFANASVYNPGIYPKNIRTKNGNLYVASTNNEIYTYNGSWTNVSLSAFSNINSIDVDSNNNVWVGTDSGLAFVSGSNVIELQSSATPSWSNGLNSNSDKLINKKINSVFVDSSFNKWFSLHSNNGLYNGGVVKYSTSSVTSANYTNSSNWSVYDKSNYSGILSNNTNSVIVTTDGSVWFATESGLSVNTGNGWKNFSETYGKIYPLDITNGQVSASISNPIFGSATNFNAVFDYGSGYVYSTPVQLNVEKQISTNIVYPSGIFSTVSAGTSQKLYSVDSDNYLDVSNGDSVTYKVYKSSNSNGPWILYKTFVNVLNPIVYDTLNSEDFFYLKTIATNNNCSFETSPVAIYGRNNSVITIKPITGNLNTNSVILVSGTVYNKDFNKNISVNGITYNDAFSVVDVGYYSSGSFNKVGSATLSTIDSTTYSYSYNWFTPVVGVSSLTVSAKTNFGTISTSGITFNTIQSVPTISVLNPIENQIIPLNSSTVLSAQGQYLIYPVSGVNFHIVSGSTDVIVGSATSAVGGYWTKSFIPSASFTPGTYSVYASAIDSNNGTNVSNYTNFSINSLPTISVLSNLSAIYSTNYNLSFVISDTNGFYNNRIDILSGSSSIVYTGYANGLGEFNWLWNSPVNGSLTLSAKVYDGNPSTSSDYVVYPLNLNLNYGTVSIIDPGYSSAVFGGSVINPKVNVVKANSTFTLSANISGTNVSGVNYWLAEQTNGVYSKTVLLNSVSGYSTKVSASVSLPSSRYYSSNGISEYKFYGIIAELVSNNGSSLQSSPVLFYSKEQSASSIIVNSTCENPIIISGNVVDSDYPYSSTSQIVDNSISAIFYDNTNSSAISQLPLTKNVNDLDTFTYNWPNPTSASNIRNVSVRVLDNYGISSTNNFYVGVVENNPYINIKSLSGSKLSAYGNVYATSGGTISASSLTNSINVSSVSYNISYGDGTVKKICATSGNGYTSSFNVSASQKYALINSELLTNGNCDIYSSATLTVVVLSSTSANLYVENCSNCYCSRGSMFIGGTILDNNFDNPYIGSLVSGYNLSASLYDSFNNLIADISNQVTGSVSNFNYSWANPTVNSTGLSLVLRNNYGLITSASKTFYKQISIAPTINVTSPVDFSASNYIYKQNEDIPIAVNTSTLSQLKIYENGTLLTVVNNPSTIYNYSWSTDKLPGTYTISIVGIDSNGCVTQVDKNLIVSNAPTIYFNSPLTRSWISNNNSINVSVDSKGNSPATVSAVKFYYPSGNLNLTLSGNSTWYGTTSAISSSGSSITLSAISYDTLNQSSSATVLVNILKPLTVSATISGTSSVSVPFNSALTVNISATTPNGYPIDYFGISGNYFLALNNSATYSINTANDLPQGLNTLVISAWDSVGGFGSSTLSIYVSSYSGKISYPTIENLGSTPANKIDYNFVTTTFQIQDNYNGIIPNTIGLVPGSGGSIQTNSIATNDNGHTYIVPVVISNTGDVTISAMNYVGKTITVSEKGFIIRCLNSRNLNLTRFLPSYLQQNFDGSESEFFQFTEFFENVLNTLYTDVDNNCNLSVLEKTYRLQNFHDIDKIDSVYIPHFADMMGYGVGINNDELGTFGLSMSGYADSEAQYKDRVLRFVVKNLPNWYSIKTTRNAVKLMLLSFGIIGDVVDKYTLDYDKYWKDNRITTGQYVSNDIGKNWYPTPHVSVGIDLKNTPNEVAYSSQISKVLTAMEDIRPANVVIDGIRGLAEDIQVPTISLNLSFKTVKSITVTSYQQINIK